MNRGRHAAEGGSFARSAGGAAARGALLVGVAVLLGLVLLRSALDADDGVAAITGSERTTTTTVAGSGTDPGSQPGDGSTTVVPVPVVRDRAEVQVLVANGSGLRGAAGRQSEQLTTLNYTVLPATDASSGDYVDSEIHYVEGYEAEAVRLANDVALTSEKVVPLAVPAPVANTQGAHLILVLGTDIASPPP